MSLNYTEPLQAPSLLTKVLLLSLPAYATGLAIWKTWFAVEKAPRTKKKSKSRK
jgi:hypothetical protein